MVQLELEIQSLTIETGYICKNCHGYLCGNYIFLQGKMYFKGECQCSLWLVLSTKLNDLFYH